MAKVLIADDEVPIAELLTELARDAGHEVWTAHNGQEALALAQREHPDQHAAQRTAPRLNPAHGAGLPRLERLAMHVRSSAPRLTRRGRDLMGCRRRQLFVAPPVLGWITIGRIVDAGLDRAVDETPVERPESWAVAAVAQVRDLVQQGAHDRAGAPPGGAI